MIISNTLHSFQIPPPPFKKGIHFKIGKSRDTFCRMKKRRPFGGGVVVVME